MLRHDYGRSFVAHVACTTPGLEGHLDCARLGEREGRAVRIADDWLIVHSLGADEPHRFWFRCLVDDARGRRYYDIQSWSRRTGRDFNSKKRHLDRNRNGYGSLYDTPVSDERLWKLMSLNDEGQFVSLDQPLQAGDSLPVRIRTRTSNIELSAADPEEVVDQWFVYVHAAHGQVLDLELRISDIGEELLHDH